MVLEFAGMGMETFGVKDRGRLQNQGSKLLDLGKNHIIKTQCAILVKKMLSHDGFE